MSGSGLTVKGRHIIDPRTGRTDTRWSRVWALAQTAAESDALSTAGMILSEPELAEVLNENENWLVIFNEDNHWRHVGKCPLPPRA